MILGGYLGGRCLSRFTRGGGVVGPRDVGGVDGTVVGRSDDEVLGGRSVGESVLGGVGWRG